MAKLYFETPNDHYKPLISPDRYGITNAKLVSKFGDVLMPLYAQATYSYLKLPYLYTLPPVDLNFQDGNIVVSEMIDYITGETLQESERKRDTTEPIIDREQAVDCTQLVQFSEYISASKNLVSSLLLDVPILTSWNRIPNTNNDTIEIYKSKRSSTFDSSISVSMISSDNYFSYSGSSGEGYFRACIRHRATTGLVAIRFPTCEPGATIRVPITFKLELTSNVSTASGTSGVAFKPFSFSLQLLPVIGSWDNSEIESISFSEPTVYDVSFPLTSEGEKTVVQDIDIVVPESRMALIAIDLSNGRESIRSTLDPELGYRNGNTYTWKQECIVDISASISEGGTPV